MSEAEQTGVMKALTLI